MNDAYMVNALTEAAVATRAAVAAKSVQQHQQRNSLQTSMYHCSPKGDLCPWGEEELWPAMGRQN